MPKREAARVILTRASAADIWLRKPSRDAADSNSINTHTHAFVYSPAQLQDSAAREMRKSEMVFFLVGAENKN